MLKRRHRTAFSAAFALACVLYLGAKLFPHFAWHNALQAAVTVCRSPCNMDADSVRTLALSVSDTPDPALRLGSMLDDLIEDPTHREACAQCEAAILAAAAVEPAPRR